MDRVSSRASIMAVCLGTTMCCARLCSRSRRVETPKWRATTRVICGNPGGSAATSLVMADWTIAVSMTPPLIRASVSSWPSAASRSRGEPVTCFVSISAALAGIGTWFRDAKCSISCSRLAGPGLRTETTTPPRHRLTSFRSNRSNRPGSRDAVINTRPPRPRISSITASSCR